MQQMHNLLEEPDVDRRIGDSGSRWLLRRYPRRVIPAKVLGRLFGLKPGRREVFRVVTESA